MLAAAAAADHSVFYSYVLEAVHLTYCIHLHPRCMVCPVYRQLNSMWTLSIFVQEV